MQTTLGQISLYRLFEVLTRTHGNKTPRLSTIRLLYIAYNKKQAKAEPISCFEETYTQDITTLNQALHFFPAGVLLGGFITIDACTPNNGLEYGSLPLAKVDIDIVKMRELFTRLSNSLKY